MINSPNNRKSKAKQSQQKFREHAQNSDKDGKRNGTVRQFLQRMHKHHRDQSQLPNLSP